MKRSDEIRQLKAEKTAEMRTLADGAKGRQMTDDERGQFNGLKDAVTGLNEELEAALSLEAEERAAAERLADQRSQDRRGGRAPKGEQGETEKIIKNFSLLRAMRLTSEGKPLDGLEAEMQQEARQEAREAGVQPNGNLQLPSMLSRSFHPSRAFQRDQTVGTATQGGHTVATDLGDLIPVLDPRLMVESMGATMLRGLRGNLDLPRGTTSATAVWEGESDANSESTMAFDKLQLSPNRLGVTTDVTKQLLAQSSIDMENYIRERLNFAVRVGVDAAAINGSGASNQPTGILNTSGIGDVVGGTNGATPDWADIVDLESELAVDNADMGRLGYLTTPGIRGYLKKTITDAGSGNYIWPVNASELNGYNVGVTTQVPSTLDKGTSTGVCHAILFGNWADLIIAQWAGIDLVVDPYTGAKNALVSLVVNSWWDVAVRHPESFAAMKDALTS